MSYSIEQWLARWCEPDSPNDTECLVSLGQLRKWMAEMEELRRLAGRSTKRQARTSQHKTEPQEQLCMDLPVGQ